MKFLPLFSLLMAVLPMAVRAQTAPIDLGAPSALDSFIQYDLTKKSVVQDLIAEGDGKKGVTLRDGAAAVSVVDKSTPISLTAGAKWTVTLDFQTGAVPPLSNLPAIGFTGSLTGLLAGGYKPESGFFIRIKTVSADQAWFDFGNITSSIEPQFGVSPKFPWPAAPSWYRLSATFEVTDKEKGQITVSASVLDLGESGTGKGTSVGDFKGQIVNADVLALSQAYVGFRLDSKATTSAINHFSLTVAK